MRITRHYVWVLCLLTMFSASHASAQGDVVTALPPVQQPIRVVPFDGNNLIIDKQVDEHTLELKLDPPCHNWFSVQLADLPTDAPVRLSFTLKAEDTKNKADVKKWVGLMPVITYRDPANPDGMECFHWLAFGQHHQSTHWSLHGIALSCRLETVWPPACSRSLP